MCTIHEHRNHFHFCLFLRYPLHTTGPETCATFFVLFARLPTERAPLAVAKRKKKATHATRLLTLWQHTHVFYEDVAPRDLGCNTRRSGEQFHHGLIARTSTAAQSTSHHDRSCGRGIFACLLQHVPQPIPLLSPLFFFLPHAHYLPHLCVAYSYRPRCQGAFSHLLCLSDGGRILRHACNSRHEMNGDRHGERHGAKFVHSNRQEIKQRIQEKQGKLRDAARRARFDTARGSLEEEGHAPSSVGHSTTSVGNTMGPSRLTEGRSVNEEMEEEHLGVDDWCAIAHEFGCDISDPSVMDWLLALEEEIRQEALFAFFDATHAMDEQWGDYYQSLAGQ